MSSIYAPREDGVSLLEVLSEDSDIFSDNLLSAEEIDDVLSTASKSNEDLLLGAIYRSPSSSEMNSRQLVSLINLAMNCKCSQTVVIGDFNFPTIDWNDWSTPHDSNHSDYLFFEFLAPSNQQAYSWHRFGQSANILDLLILDKPETVSKVEYIHNLGGQAIT